jgi:hypothetical protein
MGNRPAAALDAVEREMADTLLTCKFCSMKSTEFPQCRLCQAYVCIKHYTVIKDDSNEKRILACECKGCFGIHADSKPDNAVGW